MRCIFCRNSTESSNSVEHIIPESLGNSEHKLPRGIVCDRCNNYFAVKVEKPLLDPAYFTQARFRNALPNKKGRIPRLESIFGPRGIGLILEKTLDGDVSVYPENESDNDRFVSYLKEQRSGRLILPIAQPCEPRLVARFLAKMGLEILTQRVMHVSGWDTDVVFRHELDELRRFARYDYGRLWPFLERRIYAEQHRFSESDEVFEVLHEYCILYTPQKEIYAVIAILGIEYTINLGGPVIEGYERWLIEHEYRSPLYADYDLNVSL